jgi:hypothetical protein
MKKVIGLLIFAALLWGAIAAAQPAPEDDGIFIDGFDLPLEIYPIVLPPEE